MDDLNLGPFPEDKFKPDPDYHKKIEEEMAMLAEKLPQVAAQHPNEEIWCKVGNISYGRAITPMLIRYRVLMWMHMNPPDPRGEKMYSRPAPYVIYVRREDLAEIIPCSVRTVDRLLAEVRQEITFLQPYDKIKVELFCWIHDYPEDLMQQQLADLYERRRENQEKKKGL